MKQSPKPKKAITQKPPAEKSAPKKMGRPSKFTLELFEDICKQIAEGVPLKQILRQDPDKYPNYTVFYDWVNNDDALLKSENEEDRKKSLGLSQLLARAREDGHQAIEEELLDIADNAKNDYMERIDQNGMNAGYVLNGEHIQRSKLRIETRLKLLAIWNPKKYAANVNLKHSGDSENPVKVEANVVMETTSRMAQLKTKQAKAKPANTEVSPDQK